MALTCWYALSGKNDWTATDGFPVTIAVHRSVISSSKTWVLALGNARVWGRPAGGGGIAMTLGDGLGLGLGVTLGDGFAAAGEDGGGPPACDWVIPHPAATTAVRASPIALRATAIGRRPASDRMPGTRARWDGTAASTSGCVPVRLGGQGLIA